MYRKIHFKQNTFILVQSALRPSMKISKLKTKINAYTLYKSQQEPHRASFS